MDKGRLLRLLADNRGVKGRSARVAQQGVEATIYLYDMIVGTTIEAEYFGGIAAQDLVPQIDQLQATTIHVRVNSPGGDVFAAQAIAAALERHPANVIVHVDGLAASAATAIAMAGDEILMAEGAMFMIHNAWTIAIGDKNDFLDMAALLEKVDAALAAEYSERSGKPAAQVKQWMDAETWFTAEEAVAAGLVDSIDDDGKDKEDDSDPDDVAAMWNLAAFEKAPKRKPRAKAPEAEPPAAEEIALRARAAGIPERGVRARLARA